jgi:hypothetical protein
MYVLQDQPDESWEEYCLWKKQSKLEDSWGSDYYLYMTNGKEKCFYQSRSCEFSGDNGILGLWVPSVNYLLPMTRLTLLVNPELWKEPDYQPWKAIHFSWLGQPGYPVSHAPWMLFGIAIWLLFTHVIDFHITRAWLTFHANNIRGIQMSTAAFSYSHSLNCNHWFFNQEKESSLPLFGTTISER